MVRPFSLQDFRSVRALQPQGVEFDLERARLWPHTPLTSALAAHVPFGENGVSTFVLYGNNGQHHALGMVQSRMRRNRPEADITFISPAADSQPDATVIWSRLLTESIKRLGEHGCQRIYVQVSDENGTLDAFRKIGFSVFTHEDIYFLSPERIMLYQKMTGQHRLRRQRKRDGWYLLRLYNAITPRPVQQAEGILCNDVQSGSLEDWWDQTAGIGYVLEADTGIAGTARITRGRAASWLRLYLHPDHYDRAGELVCEAVGLARTAQPRPVYCAVREYQGGLASSLITTGFQPLTRRSLMVKYTAARVKEPALRLLPNLEKTAPVVHSRAHAHDWENEGELRTA